MPDIGYDGHAGGRPLLGPMSAHGTVLSCAVLLARAVITRFKQAPMFALPGRIIDRPCAPKCYEGHVPDLTSPRDVTSVETPRLLLRRWRSDDLDSFAAINAQPEVMRYIHDGRTLDRVATAERLATYRRHWDEHGFGLYAVELKKTGELAGFTGLAVPTFLPEIMPAVEIGWRLGRAYWGQGLATEAAQAVVAHTRAELGLRRLVSIHVVGNEASARVMVKLGMSLERETVQPDTGRQVRVYAMDL